MMDEAMVEVLQALGKLNAMGLAQAIGVYEDGTPHYEITDKGRMVLAEHAWRAA